MQTSYSFGSMDKQTFDWLTLCIETAPDIYSLDGIRVTIEWFYDLDKDFESFEKLINLISQKVELL